MQLNGPFNIIYNIIHNTHNNLLCSKTNSQIYFVNKLQTINYFSYFFNIQLSHKFVLSINYKLFCIIFLIINQVINLFCRQIINYFTYFFKYQLIQSFYIKQFTYTFAQRYIVQTLIDIQQSLFYINIQFKIFFSPVSNRSRYLKQTSGQIFNIVVLFKYLINSHIQYAIEIRYCEKQKQVYYFLHKEMINQGKKQITYIQIQLIQSLCISQQIVMPIPLHYISFFIVAMYNFILFYQQAACLRYPLKYLVDDKLISIYYQQSTLDKIIYILFKFN
eukprot:TRINITY_DN7586_c0_g1_i4.p1 TRINITY_DN7586_c0_g1~~TRINITY_DN7586_c0_g1_i4.p1  ORF type:complete len:276 (-),score=-41.61 TRINITY_DN7586_c0_g1_i4:198-1025(-)